ncbi:tripartite motif containing 35-28 [Girardinichthys multiradiatus]|uniref:tripartite motif containing 35-28 n=1 Tax=Girardinichthys multiradiatus TaxID=208333 RepID=UPI001FAC569E|nr:tripartite motif containing 35-28 [Girardinichthys multiradiatus]
MDAEMLDDSLPLRQDLTCPICQGVFKDPVLLPCSHSFCRECQKRSWQFNKTCPVCRVPFEEGQAISNRALSDASESFLRQANLRPVQNAPNEEVCNLHLKPLELYCEKDEEPVCVDCVSQHSTHRLWSLKDATGMCKKELGFKVQIFEKKVDSYKKMTKKFSNAVEYIKHQAGEAEKTIKAEFGRLHALLYLEESKRLEALSNEEKDMINSMQRMIDETEKDIAKIKELIETVKKEMGNEDLPLLKNFQNVKRQAHWVEPDAAFLFDSLINMGKHVGSLGFNIWKDMKAHVKYYPVVLDPNTASPWLSLNADLTSMVESSERMTVPDNPERFDPVVFILGAEGYRTGKHKWDVIVGDNPKWILGVCKEIVARKKKFTVSANRGMWALGLSKGVYTVHTDQRTELTVAQCPEKIRIKLNMDKGEVSFWDGGRETHLVTFKHKFEGRMFPIFGPGLHTTPMVLAPGKIAVHTS